MITSVLFPRLTCAVAATQPSTLARNLRLSPITAIATGQNVQYRSVKLTSPLSYSVLSRFMKRPPPTPALQSPIIIPETTTNTQSRPATTAPHSSATIVPVSEADSLLASQRRHRPVSPHLTIYKPQVTWILSSLNRITGVALSGTMYLFGIAYLVAPTLGWHLESASIAASFAALPIIAKIILKAGFALPFTFHSINGIRHLIWDTGSAFTNKQVIVTGWSVVGLTFASALGLAFL